MQTLISLGTFDIPEVLRTNLEASIISLVVGAVITILVTKLLAKTARLRYSTRVDRLALVADDPVFGSVRVTWGNRDVRNLYMASVEVENSSNRDFENVEFTVYTDGVTDLLGERTAIVNSPDIVKWSPEFTQKLAVLAGLAPTPDQQNIFNHRREYRVRVFNRGQILQFSYLCTRNDDVQPFIFVDTQLKGARLKQQVRLSFVLGVPLQIAAIRGLVMSAVTLLACGLLLHSVWWASGISIIVGLFGQHLGAAEYKAERWIWKVLAG
jgi:hypothetical protein